MLIAYENQTVPELTATAKQTDITFSCEEHGKLQMSEGASRTAPDMLVRYLIMRWRDIEQYLRDHLET